MLEVRVNMLEFKQFIARTDFIGYGDRHAGTFLGYLYRTVVAVNLVGSYIHNACCGARNQHLIAHLKGICLDGKLGHAKL